jgi:hypothetical protein
MSDIHLNIRNTEEYSEPWNFMSQKSKSLDTDIRDALVAQTKEPRYQHGKAFVQKEIIHRGLQYASYDATQWDSIIFFQPKPGSSLIPGTIRKIFSIPIKDPGNTVSTQSRFLAMHRYENTPDNVEDPFCRYPGFGALLWSQNVSKQVEIVDLSWKFCHGICRNWQEGILVLKPLDKVSLQPSNEWDNWRLTCLRLSKAPINNPVTTSFKIIQYFWTTIYIIGSRGIKYIV